MTDYSLAITDVLMNSCRRSRWLHLYDDCACMLFVADISRYWIRIEDVSDYENYDLLKGTSDEEAIQFVVKQFLAVVKKRDVVNVSTSDITALTGIGKVLDDLEKTVLKPLVEELEDHGVSH
ncbi:hypothetical protein Neosp_010116 [[Neocosmospora] mangrovei]